MYIISTHKALCKKIFFMQSFGKVFISNKVLNRMAKAPSKAKISFTGMDIAGAGFMKQLNDSIPVKARFNTSLYLDVITGRPQSGRYGDTVNNGGIAPYTGTIGGPNQGKSTWNDTQGLILNSRYDIPYLSHNNEAESQPERIRDLATYFAPEIVNYPNPMRDHETIKMLDLSAYSASDMHEVIRQLAFERERRRDELMRDTPFVDENGEVIRILHPFAHAQDSLSQWQSSTIDKKMGEEEVGDKSKQTFGLMHGMSKTQMIAEFPSFCARAGMMFFQTAHLGPKYQLNPYAPMRKKLEFMAMDLDMKFVANNFNYLPNNLWWIMGNAPLLKKGSDNKYYQEYPEPGSRLEKDSDLMLTSLVNLRGKNGPTGVPCELVMSQAKGYIPYLTNFRLTRESETGNALGFGISGTDKAMYLDILPEIKFNRFNLREVAEQEPRLVRAMMFNAELCILSERVKNYPRERLCSPAELYETIKKKWDWKEILDTRDHWTWDHYENKTPYLSIYDLLNMRIDTYNPYWKQ